MVADPAARCGPTQADLGYEPGIGQKGRLAQGVAAFAGTLATKVVQLRPYDPESKGIVERRNGWFETSFMPGRTFTSPADFNAGRSDRARPVADAAAAADPVAAGLARTHPTRARLLRPPRRVRLLRRPAAIGRLVDVTADLDRVRVRLDGRVVADHARVWARGCTITDRAHVATAARLRQQFQQPRPAAVVDDLTMELADCDRAFGIEEVA